MSSASRKRPTSLEKHFPKWRRVDPMEGEGEEVPMAECPRCFKKIKMNRGSLSGVRAHEKSCTVREAETEAEFERVSKQEGARTFSLETLIELVVEAGLPLNVVENSAFQKFVKSLCVSFVMPSRRSLAREIKKKVHHHSQAITDELSSIPDIGITCDVWSRSSRSSFVGIVAHFYSDAEGLGRRLIDFVDLKGRHTGANIASCIYTSLEAAGCLGKIRSITTDSASSNFRAMDLLRTEYGMGETGFVHLTCLAHKLHLSIANSLGFWATASTSDEFSDSGEEDAGDNALTSTTGLEAPLCEQQERLDLLRDEQFLAGDDDDGSEASADIDDSYDEAWREDVDRSTNRSTKGIGSLLKKLRNHSRFIRQSNIAFDLLHQSVEESLRDAHRFRIIPRDVVVRWNSTHKLLSWFSTYREGFAKYQRQCLARRGSDKLRLYMKANALSPSDEELIDTLQDLLAPFEQATRKFSGSTFTTISSVRAVTRGLSRKLKTGASGEADGSKALNRQLLEL
ncbi:hypothetical protein FOZ60_007304 [Perkinsus olseni]|uniref:Zinc finger BED domain-containing protein 4 n=1 Tax=Perkinsus olseni TaxID=32597 RepID=A0A7J6NMA9_PEROL|nr:hypothetical protein FOZ60_007304 [Perkinsus olseni]